MKGIRKTIAGTLVKHRRDYDKMVDPTSVEPTDTLQRNSYFREKFDILDLMRKKHYSKTINPNAVCEKIVI